MLSSLESVLQSAFGAVAIVAALWSARRAIGPGSSPRAGELAWSFVAVAVLVAVAAAVTIGASHGV